MFSLDNALLEIQCAYSVGSTGKESIASRGQLELQIHQLDVGMLPDEPVTIGLFSELLQKAIRTTHLGNAAEAEYLINVAMALAEKSRLSADSLCICKSYAEAARAYADYKYKRYDQALARLREALAIDEGLEAKDSKFRHLHLHRLMLVNNWIRVLAHCRDYQECVLLGLQTLDYIEQKIPALTLVPTVWNSANLSIYPIEGLSALFAATAMEIAEAITGADLIDAMGAIVDVQAIFALAWRHTQGCYLSTIAHSWLSMKQAALNEYLLEFLTWVAHIFQEGRGAWPTFWYAAELELLIACQERCLILPYTFLRTIAQDIMAWKRSPSHWKTRVAAYIE